MNVQISATAFKAKCLALLDEVQASGNSITVTKRGRPVATLGPCKVKPWKSPAGALADKFKITGDIVNFTMDWGVLHDEEPILSPAKQRRPKQQKKAKS